MAGGAWSFSAGVLPVARLIPRQSCRLVASMKNISRINTTSISGVSPIAWRRRAGVSITMNVLGGALGMANAFHGGFAATGEHTGKCVLHIFLQAFDNTL